MTHDHFTYPGGELELFRNAKNWKNYFSKQLKPFINGMVLEVGAGIGATTPLLNDGSPEQWLLLEPDFTMYSGLQKKVTAGQLPANCSVQHGTIDQVRGNFDTIIYIDVLEHIDQDSQELEKAAALLQPGGHILLLSPAFQYLYNPFDKAIGHYRRYNKKMLRSITPQNLRLVVSRYFDSAGYFAAFANRLFLKKKYPTKKQVLIWDRWLVPVSRITDPIFFHSFGKSILAVWEAPGQTQSK